MELRAVVADLTLPLAGSRTARRLIADHAERRARAFVGFPAALLAPADRPTFAAARAAVIAASRDDPAFARALFAQPTESTLITCAEAELRPGGDGPRLRALMSAASRQILTALAAARRLRIEHRAAASPAVAPLCHAAANLRVAFGPRATSIAFRDGGIAVEGGGHTVLVDLGDPAASASDLAVVDRPYHRVAAGLWLACHDNNPLAMVEAHPDKAGNALSLGGRPASEWVEALAAAVALIDAHLAGVGAELRAIGRLFVPVGFDAERHLSASYRESIGTMYLTLHPNPMTMAEAVVHEFQHNKLNAAIAIDPLLTNAWSPLYASPVRPDPRPLHGVILAVHAFQPVALLYLAMWRAAHPWSRQPAWRERFARVIALVRQGAATVLANAHATPAGAAFFDQMRAIDRELESAAAELGGASPAVGLDEIAGHD